MAIPAGTAVHEKCRYNYCNKNCIARNLRQEQATQPTRSPTTRRSQEAFSFNDQCIFCGQPSKLTVLRRGQQYEKEDPDVHTVLTTAFQSSIQKACEDRHNDHWALKVKGRIEYAQDLHAADTIYHQICSTNFRTGRDIPMVHQPNRESKKKCGRPLDTNKEEAFLKVIQYLEKNDGGQIAVTDLVKKMQEYCIDESDSFSVKHMKRRIQEYLGDKIIITNINGKADVVTFRSTAATILQAFHEEPNSTVPKAEELRIITTAANLIKNNIKCMVSSKAYYPTPEDIASIDKNSKFVPESLRHLLRSIFSERKADLKIASIGEAIVQAARPRVVIAPLQIGLAVQQHHHFASRFLIDSLYSSGFCSSYAEVKTFKMSAACSQGTDVPGISLDHSLQYVADNADHNVRTTGLGTFHGMGICSSDTWCKTKPTCSKNFCN